MKNVLEKIIDYKKDEVSAAKQNLSMAEIEQIAKGADSPRGFEAALHAKVGTGEFALIAEVKKASPSKGLIRADFDPASIARTYEGAGAACLSVLTDGPSFQGTPEYMKAARAATSLPTLRKDFMIDPYQIAEARAWGADCILIIMAALDVGLAGELAACATDDWGMDALVEVHNREEMDLALALDFTLIGINNRNLKNFITDLATTEMLAENVPDDRLLVSESGISCHDDLIRLEKSGVNSFLVGESLMRQDDVAKATRELLTRRQ